MADLPTGTVTFLFTDLEVSTRLWDLRDQLLKQASYIRVTRDNRHLRAQMTQNRGAIRDLLERPADHGCVERRTGWFMHDEPTTYAYRLTEKGDQALADS